MGNCCIQGDAAGLADGAVRCRQGAAFCRGVEFQPFQRIDVYKFTIGGKRRVGFEPTPRNPA
jgi:hypothetical protein